MMNQYKISEKQRIANERNARRDAARASHMGISRAPVTADAVAHARFVRAMGL